MMMMMIKMKIVITEYKKKKKNNVDVLFSSTQVIYQKITEPQT